MIDLAVIAAYLAVLCALGLWRTDENKDGLKGYFLAGRALTVPAFAATLVPTFYGGVLGVGEFAWSHGLSNWLVMGFPYYVFAAVYSLFLAEKVRLAPGMTIADHIEAAYGGTAAILAAFLVFWLACPADDLLMAGILLSHLAGIGLAAATAACGAVAWAVLRRGGLRSDLRANRLQFALIFAGFVIALAFAQKGIGGPRRLSGLLPPGHLSWTGGLGPWRILSWWLIAVWTLVDPSFHQRCAAAASPQVARRGILVSIIFWALLDLLTTSAGLYARAAAPHLTDPLLAFPRLADLLLPPVARGLFYAGLSSSIFAALQGKALLCAVTLGKDGLGRSLRADEAACERWSRAALVPALAAAWALAFLIPSVVSLWYAVGSAIIPGLLLPMLGAYFPALRVAKPWAIAAGSAGFLVSTLCLLWPRGGIEPMLPGLAASAALWGCGLRSAPPPAH